MSTVAATPRYQRPRRAGGPERGLAWLLIAAVHLSALAGLWLAGVELPLPKVPQTLMVSFVTEPVAAVEPPRPPPPKPEQPRMVATPRPTPAAIQAPAPEPTPAAPAESAPAAEPGPPAPAAEPVVVPPNFAAAHLNNPGPQVPYQSRKLGEQGTVWLRVLVNPDGRPQQVLVDRGSGYARLDAAAVEVVQRRWRFVPARRGEEAIAAWVLVPISFERSNR
ncbi:MAG: energy transducer TonB [Stagnimonas sp.]|nr:energy transducer TonB [Stagnimonas sp.]